MAAVSDPIPSLADLHAVGAAQQPSYADPAEVARVVKALRTRPPLVFAGEIDELRTKIAAAASTSASQACALRVL